jgi:hypothetical protein
MTAKEKIRAAGGTVIELDAPEEEPEEAPKPKKAKTKAKRPEAAPKAESEPESAVADGEEADSGDGG